MMRNIVKRIIKSYMRGLGKLQDEKDVLGQVPNNPADLQFSCLPEGGGEPACPNVQPPRQESNFFNMKQVAAAKRSFSSCKQIYLDNKHFP